MTTTTGVRTFPDVNVVDFAECVARDLHDGPLQDVFATRLRLDALADRVPPDLEAELRQLSELQGRIILRMRQLGKNNDITPDRHPSALIADTVDDASIALGYSPHCSIDPRVDAIHDPALLSDVVHAVRESLSNVARHARASQVRLAVAVDPTTLRFTVHDNGVGIPPTGRRGNGLVNLRTRAERNGGSCTFRDAAGGGTIVDWCVPRGDAPRQYGSTGGPEGSSCRSLTAAL